MIALKHLVPGFGLAGTSVSSAATSFSHRACAMVGTALQTTTESVQLAAALVALASGLSALFWFWFWNCNKQCWRCRGIDPPPICFAPNLLRPRFCPHKTPKPKTP